MRLIRNDGKVRVRKVKDNKGRTSGFQIDHKDGRVDAVVRPQPVRGKSTVDGR